MKAHFASPSRHADLATWEECEKRISEIEDENKQSLSGVSYRGVADSDWPLTTTLERRISRPYSVSDYFQLMSRIKPEIEAFTGKQWDEPVWSEPDTDFGGSFRKNPALTIMAHLRHHGFPSPLLDWTRSPFVAAYFAFANPQTGKHVAIYAFSETPYNRTSGNAWGPKIVSHGGHALATHVRHFRQQSCYTVCVQRDDGSAPWKFVPHQEIFEADREDQDRLYKITLPASERRNVLRSLDRYNLNGYSLFGSEERLMETLAFREMDDTEG